jgi:membrane fusion protein, macrolide-specific efflux system
MRTVKFALIFLAAILLSSCAKETTQAQKTATVTRGAINTSITSVGIVTPRNRLEIKPPIAGRVEQVLVSEGNNVTKGQTLAWMSSSDRATLIDAARAKGAEEQKYWEEIYRPAPVIAPLTGFIIKRSVEPGQSVTAGDAIIVMADRLIVKAQVDETDIGKISKGRKVILSLDAYPDKDIEGRVEHIAYESRTVSNVNIYEVDVIPEKVPPFFKSGMSASAKFVLSASDNALLLPAEAVKSFRGGSYVVIQDNKEIKISRIETGPGDGANIEIVSGLKEGDTVIIPDAKLSKELYSSGRRAPAAMNIFGGSR